MNTFERTLSDFRGERLDTEATIDVLRAAHAEELERVRRETDNLRATIERQAAEMQAREASYMDALAAKSIRIDEQATLIESLQTEIERLREAERTARDTGYAAALEDIADDEMCGCGHQRGLHDGEKCAGAYEKGSGFNGCDCPGFVKEADALRAKMATMVCGTCRGTGCTHGYKGCTLHPCPVCQPKGTP